jgi:hypothetical protein
VPDGQRCPSTPSVHTPLFLCALQDFVYKEAWRFHSRLAGHFAATLPQAVGGLGKVGSELRRMRASIKDPALLAEIGPMEAPPAEALAEEMRLAIVASGRGGGGGGSSGGPRHRLTAPPGLAKLRAMPLLGQPPRGAPRPHPSASAAGAPRGMPPGVAAGAASAVRAPLARPPRPVGTLAVALAAANAANAANIAAYAASASSLPPVLSLAPRPAVLGGTGGGAATGTVMAVTGGVSAASVAAPVAGAIPAPPAPTKRKSAAAKRLAASHPAGAAAASTVLASAVSGARTAGSGAPASPTRAAAAPVLHPLHPLAGLERTSPPSSRGAGGADVAARDEPEQHPPLLEKAAAIGADSAAAAALPRAAVATAAALYPVAAIASSTGRQGSAHAAALHQSQTSEHAVILSLPPSTLACSTPFLELPLSATDAQRLACIDLCGQCGGAAGSAGLLFCCDCGEAFHAQCAAPDLLNRFVALARRRCAPPSAGLEAAELPDPSHPAVRALVAAAIAERVAAGA